MRIAHLIMNAVANLTTDQPYFEFSRWNNLLAMRYVLVSVTLIDSLGHSFSVQ